MANQVQVKPRTEEDVKAEEAKKKQELEKKKKEKLKNPEKKQFDIKLECLVPCTITYRVLAEDEAKALEMCDKIAHRDFKPSFMKKIKLKATVYDTGKSIIRFVKNFRT